MNKAVAQFVHCVGYFYYEPSICLARSTQDE
jgi:hypothetical protein